MMKGMAVAPKRLEVQIGDVVEVDGRRYDVVPGASGGVTLEPTVTKTAGELREERGGRALSEEEFERAFGDLPSDGEG